MKAVLARLHVKPKQVAPHTTTSEFINLESSLLSENGKFAVVRERLNLSLRGWYEATQGRFIDSALKYPISFNLSFSTKSAGKNIVQ